MDLLRKMTCLADTPCRSLVRRRATIIPPAGGSNPVLQLDMSVEATDKAQQDWRPPPMVPPIEEEDERTEGANIIALGDIATDASLYLVEEKVDGMKTSHHFLKIPSRLPENVNGTFRGSSNVFNLLMVDVSGSMTPYWKGVEDGWNLNIAPHLSGRTAIYTFGSSVTFRGSGTLLDRKYFDSGGTDLTGALQTIVNEVYQCTEKYVNVFVLTDGNHNMTSVEPSVVINEMQPPLDKICSVYVLGIGNDFPVQYSVDIRSRLHNGSSNIPSLFWSQQKEDTIREMIDINERMSDGNMYRIKLNTVGSVLPGLPTKDTFHPGEWVYLASEPNQDRILQIEYKGYSGSLILEPQEVNIDDLSHIFRQWNSITIQLHRNRENVPKVVLKLRERLLNRIMEMGVTESRSIKDRKLKKELKARVMELREEFKKLWDMLTEEQFEDQIKLANTILSTTVSKPKYKISSLQLKGHTDKEFETDREDFLQVYSQVLPQIKALDVTPDDCCRITMSSTISDLQDSEDFVEMLKDFDKFNFLKTFTITGIPVYAPTRDSAILNPWSFSVRAVLRSPYTIMSQAAMESFADMRRMDEEDKVVQIKYDEDDTKFNAIIPVFPPAAAKAMKLIVKTRLYAMCVNFATLKNPHVLDVNIHMASLAVTWVWCLYENPSQPRPEHARLRIESIEATAILYLDEPRYANYMKVLAEHTSEALMTESKMLVNNKPVKCETLVKPMFFLNMMKKYSINAYSLSLEKSISLMLMEYIGRCLSGYESGNHQSTPYCDFFAESLDDEHKRRDWVKQYISKIRAGISGNERELLTSFYTLEKVSKSAKVMATGQVKALEEDLSVKIRLKVDIEKIEKLSNVAVAGDVSWFTLRAFAQEIGLQKELIDQLFSKESVFIYTAHALQYRSSRERLSMPMVDLASSHSFVLSKVQEEGSRHVVKLFSKELVTSMRTAWLKAYFDVHTEVVQPMTRQEIISKAQQKGIEVSEEAFDQIYSRFRQTTGLLSNACQTKACPYYLQPHKSYSEHAKVERERGQTPFVHSLHEVTQQMQNEEVSAIARVVASGSHTKLKKPIPMTGVSRLSSEIGRLKVIYQEVGNYNPVMPS